VDDDGNIVGETRTTAEGQYRFRNVKKGKYKVRVTKDGWGAEEQDVEAAPAAESSADLDL
jgi:protocatechuate 3,4-dioxygenase beta subunit